VWWPGPRNGRGPSCRTGDEVVDVERTAGISPSLTGSTTMKTVIVLLTLWLILAVVGFALKGLLWLAIIGIVLFVGNVVFGAIRRYGATAKRTV
jgi:hypothetical protein